MATWLQDDPKADRFTPIDGGPDIIWDDPRCTPDDTFATWFLKNQWPALAHGPFAEAWALTERTLRIQNPLPTMACKACGRQGTPENSLYWGNLETAEAHGIQWNRVNPGITKSNKSKLIKAQDLTITSGDTDVNLIGYHTQAPMIYCLGCTLVLSTKVINHSTGNPQKLAFWWTPAHEAWPWTNYGALWELPRERPLVFRALPGSGKNNEKWAMTVAVNWDPRWVLFPLSDRNTMRGIYWLPIASARIAELPVAYMHWMDEQRRIAAAQKVRWRNPDDPDISRWVHRALQLPSRDQQIAPIGWVHKAIADALKAYDKAHRPPDPEPSKKVSKKNSKKTPSV